MVAQVVKSFKLMNEASASGHVALGVPRSRRHARMTSPNNAHTASSRRRCCCCCCRSVVAVAPSLLQLKAACGRLPSSRKPYKTTRAHRIAPPCLRATIKLAKAVQDDHAHRIAPPPLPLLETTLTANVPPPPPPPPVPSPPRNRWPPRMHMAPPHSPQRKTIYRGDV